MHHARGQKHSHASAQGTTQTVMLSRVCDFVLFSGCFVDLGEAVVGRGAMVLTASQLDVGTRCST